MSTNPLNDISKVYLDQIAEKKKDDTYLEPDMKKRQANNEKARKDLMKGPQMKNPHFEEKQLDPVGQEDADVDNDGKKNTKTDKYLKNRRKAIGKAIAAKEEVEVPSGNIKKLVSKATKRVDTDVDGDVDNNDKNKGEYGEFVPSPSGKKKVTTKMEGSNWRAKPTEGSYFQVLDYSLLSNLNDVEFTENLVTQFGISTIPVSP